MFKLKIEVKEMTKRKLKKPVLYGIYACIALFAFSTIYVVETNVLKGTKKEEQPSHVSKTIFEEDNLPVVNETEEPTLIRPYTDTEIQIVKNYYDYQAEAENQVNSIIYHENTYLQNSGVSYGGKDNFDVVAILDGTVTDVKEDDLLGKIIEIKHDNNIISTYQSLSEISINKNDTVKQGQVIGKSGTCNISKELNSHLTFELIIKGQIVNPENYYDKKISEL